MELAIKKNRETISQKEDYEINVNRELDKLKHEIYDRVNRYIFLFDKID